MTTSNEEQVLNDDNNDNNDKKKSNSNMDQIVMSSTIVTDDNIEQQYQQQHTKVPLALYSNNYQSVLSTTTTVTSSSSSSLSISTNNNNSNTCIDTTNTQQQQQQQQQQQYRPTYISRIGLGCSSFSTFFWTNSDSTTTTTTTSQEEFTVTTIQKDHPIVQEWINTIIYSIQVAGINIIDTAPWYGHGTSEIVIGWAIEKLEQLDNDTSNNTTNNNTTKFHRDDIIINTKIGRYDSNPINQFDYTYEKTITSVKRSIERMKCSYINIVQLHDPEFIPNLEILYNETIPALLYCKHNNYCKSIGITGYPLLIQYYIIQQCIKLYGGTTASNGIIFDQSLTYGHFNLHDTSLITYKFIPNNSNNNNSISNNSDTTGSNDNNNAVQVATTTTEDNKISFLDYCTNLGIVVLAAAPLSMGLLTNNPLPTWHPASQQLKDACQTANSICIKYNILLSDLAILYSITHPHIPCTIIGMKNIQQVQTIQHLLHRLDNYNNSNYQDDTIDTNTNTKNDDKNNNEKIEHMNILKKVLTTIEWNCLQEIIDPINGPFAQLGSNYQWDGIEQVHMFWQQLRCNKSTKEQEMDDPMSFITSNGTKVTKWQNKIL